MISTCCFSFQLHHRTWANLRGVPLLSRGWGGRHFALVWQQRRRCKHTYDLLPGKCIFFPRSIFFSKFCFTHFYLSEFHFCFPRVSRRLARCYALSMCGKSSAPRFRLKQLLRRPHPQVCIVWGGIGSAGKADYGLRANLNKRSSFSPKHSFYDSINHQALPPQPNAMSPASNDSVKRNMHWPVCGLNFCFVHGLVRTRQPQQQHATRTILPPQHTKEHLLRPDRLPHAILSTFFFIHFSWCKACKAHQTLSPEAPQVNMFDRVPHALITSHNNQPKERRGENLILFEAVWKAAESVIMIMFGVSTLPQNETPEVSLLSEVEKKKEKKNKRKDARNFTPMKHSRNRKTH